MSLAQPLAKARQLVQSGQYDAAIKLYRGLLRLTPKHPLVNSLLGALLIQIGKPEQAVKPLEIAFALAPEHPENWVRLLIAHHRGGDIHRARELLELGASLGVPEERLAVFRKDLSEPPETAVSAIEKLIESGNKISAEIAVRMMLADYPTSATAKGYLTQVLQMEAVNEQ